MNSETGEIENAYPVVEWWISMNVYEEFIEIMKQNNLNKEAVIDVLNIYVNLLLKDLNLVQR